MIKIKKIQIKNILVVVGFPGIGDLLVAIPVFRALREIFPEAKLCLTIRNRAGQLELLKGNPYFNKIIIFDKKDRGLNLLESLKLLKKWKKEHFEVIVILHHARRYALLSWLAGAKLRLGYNTKGWQFFLNNVYLAKPFQPETENLLEVIKPLGVETKNLDLELWLEGEERRKLDSWLKERNISDFIVIHPAGGWWGRRWPKENYANLTDYLIKNYPLEVIFTGTISEKREIDRITELMEEKPIVAAGEFSIRELACLYKRARLFIGTDTGAMHIAEAVGLPSLIMFGPQDPRRWGPKSQTNYIIYKHLDCSPCPQRCRWKRNICLEKIKVDEVMEAVGKMLLSNTDKSDINPPPPTQWRN